MRDVCIVYGAKLYEKPIATINNMPCAAQHLPDEETVKQDKGISLVLTQCKGCGLVQHSPADANEVCRIILNADKMASSQ